MANEKRGDYSEAVVAASLRAIPFFHRKLTTYHAVLPGCGVCVSDIIWGPLDNPNAVIQITSSGYQGNFQQKFWRDAGELFEVKKNFPTARLIQVLFKDGTREKLVGIQKQIWDGVVEVPKLRLGNTLMHEIDYASENEPRPNFEARIKHVMASFSEESVKELGEAIRVILNGRNDKVWSIRFKKERSAEKSEPRQINIRNAVLDAIILSYPKTEGGAIAKQLSLFSNGKTPTIGKLGWSGDKISILESVGLLRRMGGHLKLADKNLVWSLDRYGADGLARIATDNLAKNKNGKLEKYCKIIQSIPSREPIIHSAILRNLDRWLDPSELGHDILSDFNVPGYLCEADPELFIEPWVVKRLFDFLRCAHNRHFYIGVPAFDELFPKHGLQAFRFTYTDYLDRKRPLKSKEIRLISERLSQELALIDEKKKVELSRFIEFVERSEYKQRYRAYRGVNPGRLLVESSASQLTFGSVEPEICAELGIRGAATCIASVEEDAIYITQSATKGGVAHKVNEVVGRIGMLLLTRKEVDGKTNFEVNAEKITTGIFLDGAWSEDHIKLLINAGFSDVRRAR